MEPPDVSVIVPTYREAENLPVLVPRLAEALGAAGLRGEILVVDDDSPDGTAAVCEELAARHPLRLIVRRGERGLSGAVVHGMSQAAGDVLVVMDADLSHPPETVPDLVGVLRREEADFVIGSRYVRGGGTAEDWGVFRWLNSKVATLLARPLTPAKDPMAGFFALRRSLFLSTQRLDPIGYKIGLELMVKAGCKRVREVPIAFENRLHGSSKLTLRQQWDYLRHLKRLYEFKLGALARPAQFALVGASGMAVDLACFAALLWVARLGVARALAVWAAMTWNFWLNRRLTFSDARAQPVLPQYLLFCLSCALGAVVNWAVSVGLATRLAWFGRWPLVAAACGVVAGAALNYGFSTLVAFRRRPPPSAG